MDLWKILLAINSYGRKTFRLLKKHAGIDGKFSASFHLLMFLGDLKTPQSLHINRFYIDKFFDTIICQLPAVTAFFNTAEGQARV